MQPKAVVDDFSIEQLVPYFQPIFDLNIHKVSRYECLSRLVTPQDNIYYPNEFLYIISRAQSNAAITQRMLELSVAYCLPRNMACSINMFKTDLLDNGLKKWLNDCFANYQTNLLGVEFSFDSVNEQPYILHSLIEEMPYLHITIEDVTELDNKLKSVISCGVDAIKISGNSIKKYAKKNQGETKLKHLVEYCHEKECTLIAEHIEDDQTLDSVLSLGVKYGQGFHLSTPSGRMTSLKQV